MNENFYNTIRWSVTIGTNPGYNLQRQERMDYGEITSLFQKISEEEQKQSGVWVTAVIFPSRLAYMTSVGCPPGGEYSYTLTGICNTAFTSAKDYVPALRRVFIRLKNELKQATVTLEIMPAHIDYFTNDDYESDSSESNM